ncbi:MAG: aspartyl protease family protein [Planctomycetales bacterium]
MKFAYREYVGVFPGTNDFRLILRPIITVRIVGPKADARWDALVDSGADETLFPLSIAEALGIDLDPQMTSEASGITGDRLKIQYGDAELRIESDEEFIVWKTPVGFVDFGSASDGVVILGHGGCLDFFTATFDGEIGELERIPNSLLPSSTAPA